MIDDSQRLVVCMVKLPMGAFHSILLLLATDKYEWTPYWSALALKLEYQVTSHYCLDLTIPAPTVLIGAN